MKKKIITSVIITVMFALIIVTSSFVALINVQEIDETKEILSVYNSFISHEINENNETNLDIDAYKIKGKSVRITVIKKDGEVIFDSDKNDLDNHSDREEIIEAFESGSGSSVRYSNTLGVSLVYYATKISDGIVVRSSVPVSTIKVFTATTFKYYSLIILMVILLSLALSYKLVKIIVYPVKELERVTSKIAGGELNKRAVIYNYDEIGSLAKTFNEMADQLQIKINDVIDKQDKLEAILESMDSGVMALDNNNKIILINPYVRKLFDLKGDVIGKNIANHIIDYDILNFVRNIPDINSREIKLFHPVEREIRVKKAPIISENNNSIGIVVAIQDITDIKRLENMRSQFVANVSHELKTPLTSIKGFAETLRYVGDESTRNKFLDIINNEAERLTRLINDILALSNLENLHKMKMEQFKPSEIIQESLDIVKAEANNKDIQVSFNNNYSGNLVGDRDKFYQMCLNLIENSIKYSNNGTVVNVNIIEKDAFVILQVEDNGIGIPREDLPRIFERFYRVDKSRSTRGTGLGLAIVKHIVKLFDGDIFVESTLGKGTKFTIKIKR